MPIRVTCPGCGKVIDAPDAAAGRTGKCVACGTKISVPATATVTAPPPLPPHALAPKDDFDGVVPAAIAEPPPPTRRERDCPFCGEPILAVAAKCRHCGEFLSQPPSHAAGQPEAVTTTQATSKKWKGMQLMGVALLLVCFPVGVVVASAVAQVNEGVGPVIVLLSALASLSGAGVFIYARVMAWWHHG